MRDRRRSAALAVVVCATLLVAACGGGDDRLVVLAAASLTEVLPQVSPDARYSFAGSSALATQVREGAPADLYIAASPRYPGELAEEGLVGSPTIIARNRLVLIVPPDNRAHIMSVHDLARDGTRLVLAAEGVPAGDYAREALAALGADGALANLASNEDDVKAVVGKVVLGEADAGIVYATDAAVVADDVEVLPIPAEAQPDVVYVAAPILDSPRVAEAQAFIDRLLANRASVLTKAGFESP